MKIERRPSIIQDECGTRIIYPDHYSFVIVQNITERDNIPCSLRQNGMIAIVVESDFAKFQIKTTESYGVCNNDSWVHITESGSGQGPTAEIFKFYPNISDLLADQSNQIEQQIYIIKDATEDTNLKFPQSVVEEYALYRFNGIATGGIEDYEIISAPNAISVHVVDNYSDQDVFGRKVFMRELKTKDPSNNTLYGFSAVGLDDGEYSKLSKNAVLFRYGNIESFMRFVNGEIIIQTPKNLLGVASNKLHILLANEDSYAQTVRINGRAFYGGNINNLINALEDVDLVPKKYVDDQVISEGYTNLLDDNDKIKDQYIPDDIGIYDGNSPSTVSVGDLNVGTILNGKTYVELFESIFAPYQTPEITNFNLVGVPTVSEKGTEISGIKSFSYSYTNVNNVTDDLKTIRNTTTGVDNTFTGSSADSPIQMDVGSITTDTTWRLHFNDMKGNYIYKDTTIRFYNRRFFGSSLNEVNDSIGVRTLPRTSFDNASTTFTLNTNPTDTYFYIALPETRNLISVQDLETNSDVTSQYILKYPAMQVEDAGGNLTTYKLYEMTIAVPFSSPHRHEIKIS